MGPLRRNVLKAALVVALGTGTSLLDPTSLGRAGRLRADDETDLPPGQLAVLDQLGIWLVSPDGSRRRLAAPPTGSGGWLQDPTWSPDGTSLAYASVQFRAAGTAAAGSIPWPTASVLLLRPFGADGTPRVVAGPEMADEALLSPVWAPDGRSLFVVRRRPVARGMQVVTDVLRIGLTGGERQALGSGAAAIELAASAEGALAYVASHPLDALGRPLDVLEVVSPDGVRRSLASTTEGFDFLRLPRFAPGGQRLAFAGGAGPSPGMADSHPILAPFVGTRPAAAHGARGWAWIADLEHGGLQRVPGDGFDDLAGLAWLPGEGRLLILDAFGFGVLDTTSGSLARVPGTTGTAFAWHSGT
jgi:hypothetical protein